MTTSVSRRHRLATRLLAASVIVGASAVVATAWLTVHTTTDALQVRQSQVLANDSRIYNALLTYAATHPSWDSAGPVVRQLGAVTGLRIRLVSGGLHIDTSPRDNPPPTGVSAVIDALAEDSSLALNATPDRIASAAVGPFRLPVGTAARLKQNAVSAAACLRKQGFAIDADVAASGRPYFSGALPADTGCLPTVLTVPTSTERSAVDQLQKLVSTCLAGDRFTYNVELAVNAQSSTPAQVVLSDGTRTYTDPTTLPQQARTCLTAARREQLGPFVAPPGLLYVTDLNGRQPSTPRLGSVNVTKVAIAGAIVLIISSLITAATASRLVRPLRRLTAAAQRVRDGDITATVPMDRRDYRRRDEVGQLAEAFNDMSRSRQDAETTRRTMVADIAHELRTPLSNIRGWLEAIQDDVATPTPELIASLTSQSIQLQHVVDDLQDLAIADAGKLSLHLSPLDVGDLVAQVAAACGVQANASGVTMAVHRGGEPAVINGDPVRLGQALANLVTNAIQYSPSGGNVTITDRRAGSFVAIDVTDTGTGVSDTDLPHVFDRFWRADPSRGRHNGGSGLGLAIAKRLAQAHGGDITARSTLGAGSTFTLTIPA